MKVGQGRSGQHTLEQTFPGFAQCSQLRSSSRNCEISLLYGRREAQHCSSKRQEPRPLGCMCLQYSAGKVLIESCCNNVVTLVRRYLNLAASNWSAGNLLMMRRPEHPHQAAHISKSKGLLCDQLAHLTEGHPGHGWQHQASCDSYRTAHVSTQQG